MSFIYKVWSICFPPCFPVGNQYFTQGYHHPRLSMAILCPWVLPQPSPPCMKDVRGGIQVCPPSHCISFIICHYVQFFPCTLLPKSRHQALTNPGHTHQGNKSSICGRILRNELKLVDSHALSTILLWLLSKGESGRLSLWRFVIYSLRMWPLTTRYVHCDGERLCPP